MKSRAGVPRCTVAGCGTPAAYQFLAVTGGDGLVVTDTHGTRVRSCQQHMMGVVGRIRDAMAALPGGGPARLRAVPLIPG